MIEHRVCIADRVKQYLDLGLKNLKFMNEDQREDMRQKVYWYYNEIRIDPDFINGQNPMSIAVGILYYTARILGFVNRSNWRWHLTQGDIARSVGYTVIGHGHNTTQKHAKRLHKYLSKRKVNISG